MNVTQHKLFSLYCGLEQKLETGKMAADAAVQTFIEPSVEELIRLIVSSSDENLVEYGSLNMNIAQRPDWGLVLASGVQGHVPNFWTLAISANWVVFWKTVTTECIACQTFDALIDLASGMDMQATDMLRALCWLAEEQSTPTNMQVQSVRYRTGEEHK